MIDKSKYDSDIAAIEQIAERYSLPVIAEAAAQVRKEIEGFELKVVFAGHFNAGKSYLINSLIERPGFLLEDQVPATAIAAEIVYGDEEYVEIVREDNSRIKVKIEEASGINAPETDHIRYSINSEVMRRLRDYVIVDTPGFDSGLEKHDRAVNLYIPCASCYVIVLSIEKGTADNQTLGFMRELSTYSNRMAVLINKCEKSTPENTESVKSSVETVLAANGFDCPIYTVSKYGENISSQLTDIILSFDAQSVFNSHADSLLDMITEDAVIILTSMKNTLEEPDTFEIDKQLRDIERAKEKIKAGLDESRMEAEEELPHRLDEIKESIRGELLAKADEVATALMSGGAESAIAVINEAVRPILLQSVKIDTIRLAEEISYKMQAAVNDLKNVSESVENLAGKIVNDVRTIIDKDLFSHREKNEKKKEDDKKKKSGYQAATGILAALTDIVAPWLEVVIILAPDIINLLKKVFGASERDKLRQMYINSMIPQIMNSMHEPIINALRTSTDYMIGEIESQANEKLDILARTKADIQRIKSEEVDKVEKFAMSIDGDIRTLEKIMGGK